MEIELKVGIKFEHTYSFLQEDVIKFSEATGDNNPLHLSDDYAKKTIFGKKIIHGFLGGSVFSKIFGTIFPGEGTIYLKQNMKFIKPMFVNQEYLAVIEFIEVNKEKKRAVVKTQIFDNNSCLVLDGDALIQNPYFY